MMISLCPATQKLLEEWMSEKGYADAGEAVRGALETLRQRDSGPPEELQLQLMDCKKGEFKSYAATLKVQEQASAGQGEREFGLEILRRTDAELVRRGELFRRAEVRDLIGFQDRTGTRMPSSLLIIDQFRRFFGEDDRVAQEASGLLDRLVRQGSVVGIRMLLEQQAE